MLMDGDHLEYLMVNHGLSVLQPAPSPDQAAAGDAGQSLGEVRACWSGDHFWSEGQSCR